MSIVIYYEPSSDGDGHPELSVAEGVLEGNVHIKQELPAQPAVVMATPTTEVEEDQVVEFPEVPTLKELCSQMVQETYNVDVKYVMKSEEDSGDPAAILGVKSSKGGNDKKHNHLTMDKKIRLYGEIIQLKAKGPKKGDIAKLASKYNVNRNYPGRILKMMENEGATLARKPGGGRRKRIDEEMHQKLLNILKTNGYDMTYEEISKALGVSRECVRIHMRSNGFRAAPKASSPSNSLKLPKGIKKAKGQSQKKRSTPKYQFIGPAMPQESVKQIPAEIYSVPVSQVVQTTNTAATVAVATSTETMVPGGQDFHQHQPNTTYIAYY